MAKDQDVVLTWRKRIEAARTVKKEWESECRVEDCYQYWRGNQLAKPFDEFRQRKAQVNKIHAEVKNNLPSLYFYRPFARLQAAPEREDDPGTTIEDQTQLLQDTVNHLIRDPQTMFRENTHLALKEAHWAMGAVEVGYDADYMEAPNVQKPELKEHDDTKGSKKPEIEEPSMMTPVDPGMPAMAPNGLPSVDPQLDPMTGLDPETAALMMQAEVLKQEISRERFFVKFIPSKQVLCSITDRPLIDDNDWIGYWEDVPLEDVKRSKTYKNTKDLEANTGDERDKKKRVDFEESTGTPRAIRLYKIWDMRTKTKYVFAEGHEKVLLAKTFKRRPLKFLRFDVDPYHFYPRPPLLSKLGPQDEYNDSREYLRKIRKGTVPRYTYDEDAVDASMMQKLESGDIGTFVPRKGSTSAVIEPVQQPSFSENAIKTLTLADKEFMDVGGVGGDARIAETKTATQAKIAEAKTQAQDSFERTQVAEFLAEVADELLRLSIDHMNVDQWVAINVASDSQYADQLSMQIDQSFKMINAQILSDNANGISWEVIVDVESISPVSEQEKAEKWFKGLELIANPQTSRLFAVAPPLLKRTLKYLGITSAADQGAIAEGLQQLVIMEQNMASMGQNTAKGMPSQAKEQPNQPQPNGPQPEVA